jgi:hypothetical protein
MKEAIKISITGGRREILHPCPSVGPHEISKVEGLSLSRKVATAGGGFHPGDSYWKQKMGMMIIMMILSPPAGHRHHHRRDLESPS